VALDITETGDDYHVVTSWDKYDVLKDVDVPGWIDDVLVRLFLQNLCQIPNVQS